MTTPEQAPLLLLIDDSPAIHRLLAFKLKNDGVEFLSAFTGGEGFELARAHQPALILLDLNMPGTDGFHVLRQLKNDPKTIEIPVIVVTGSTESREKVQAFEQGAMDVVAKPFDAPELRARIQSALRMTRLMRMLEHRAQIDGLTGLWNRKHFNDRLANEIDCAARKSTPLSLMICDLDHFKKINDTYGHPVGDSILQDFANVLTKEIRSYDIPCRYGGEEFAIILPDTSPDQALAVAERVRAGIEARRWANHPNVQATASFGVTDTPARDLSGTEAWIAAADRALYFSKQNGRNRVTHFSTMPPVPTGSSTTRAHAA
ncbi:MAG TPA: diguanylate cyclase [Phycisphaerales bacterium]|nr:diguanylate cyclase [Phycisphaerales bacterium]